MRAFLLLAATLLLALAGAASASAYEDKEGEHADKPAGMALPAGHPIELPEGISVELREIEAIECAYLEGTLMGDMDALFGKLIKLAGEQGLINDETTWGSAYPDDMSQGVDETTRVYVGIGVGPEAEVTEPLLRGTIPGGMYLMAQHWGPYEQLEDTYIAVYTWAAEHGVVFGTPSFEHYVTDPDTTPVGEWLTEIYFPFDHEAMKAAFMAEHGHEDHDHEADHQNEDHDHGEDHRG
jgi:effector-binding domain-containing protein